MTNGTSGDERHRRVRAGLAFNCEGSSDTLWAITQFQIRKRFTASELFSGFLAPDKLYLLTVPARLVPTIVVVAASKSSSTLDSWLKLVCSSTLPDNSFPSRNLTENFASLAFSLNHGLYAGGEFSE
jgi:hypothetical protein